MLDGIECGPRPDAHRRRQPFASTTPGPMDISATDTLGSIYLPQNPGTPVGTFDFIVDPDTGLDVEIGTPVAADTEEGTVVGTVVDMRTVGTERDPIASSMSAGSDPVAHVSEVIVATVQVFHSERLRSVRAGQVRAATEDEMLTATGYHRMDWPIPAGVVGLAGGTYAKVCLDGHSLLGPEAAHLTVGGLSGQAAKTSYMGTLLRSAIHSGSEDSESVAALLFNVKGTDLIYLDRPPTEGYELAEGDEAIYAALGIPSTPFDDVEVWAPGLPGGNGSTSPRADAITIRWDLRTVWKYLRHFLPAIWDDEKAQSFLAEFGDRHVFATNPRDQIGSFDELDRWFGEKLEEAEETETPYAWRSHHKMTMWRLRRMLMGIVARAGGLVAGGTASDSDDIPVQGWTHGRILVVDIAGLTPEIQGIVIARTCERILSSAEAGELGVAHLIVMMDELNSFAPSTGAEMGSVRKVLQKISTQGRYAGISLWGAGQKLSKTDELVRDNAATRALGITVDAELNSGVYGRLAGGLQERIATLPRGQMALWHYSFRGALVVAFPRPAWQTGKAKTTGDTQRRKGVLDSLGLTAKAVANLTEGLSPEAAEAIVARADNRDLAIERLEAARVRDARRVTLSEPKRVNITDPFGLNNDPDDPSDNRDDVEARLVDNPDFVRRMSEAADAPAEPLDLDADREPNPFDLTDDGF